LRRTLADIAALTILLQAKNVRRRCDKWLAGLKHLAGLFCMAPNGREKPGLLIEKIARFRFA